MHGSMKSNRQRNGWRDSRTIAEVEGLHITRARQKEGIKARGMVNAKPFRDKELKAQAQKYAEKGKVGRQRGTWVCPSVPVLRHSEGAV